MAVPIINVSILNGSNGFRLDGAKGSSSFGRSVSTAGDVNGDGFDDVIIGSSDTSYVVFGKASGFDATLGLSSLDGSNGFRLDGAGHSVSGAEDVNGDGFDDLIIGSPSSDLNGDFSGSSYVVFGKNSGFDATMNLSSLDGNNGFRLDGAEQGDQSGTSVSNAGDINGDGFDDLIVNASRSTNKPLSDSSYIVFGKNSGFDATMNLSSLDGNNGFRLDGRQGGDRTLTSLVSNAGDINGDGFDDLIIGDPFTNIDFDSYYSHYSYFSGTSYVVFGKASGFNAAMNLSSLEDSDGFSLTSERLSDYVGKSVSSAGDLNNDGFSDVIISADDRVYVVFGKASGFTTDLSSLDGINGFRLDGRGFSVSGAGDVNGDGFDDVIIGSSDTSYVVFGKASGFDATLGLSSLDGSNGFRLDGAGHSVSGAGDVNGDGFDDLIIGSPGSYPNGINSGSSYVIFGGDFINETVYLGTPGEDNLIGTPVAERFEAGDGNDRMTGLGGADVFHGGAGNDTIVIGTNFDFQSIDGGTGADTLEFAGNLNLADFRDTTKSIETLKLTGSGQDILKLTLPDLLSLSDTTTTFTVNGNGGDRVIGLKSGWKDGGIDGNYHIYTNQGTVLRVNKFVNTDLPEAGVINLADLNGENGFRLDGANYDHSGFSVSGAGDINGDGFDDVIIGSRNHPTYVVFGQASGFESTMNLSSLHGSNGFRLNGDGHSGWSVSSAGDINADGFDDLIIGVSDPHLNENFSGSSYVVFGKNSGFDATMDLSSLDGNNGFRLDGVDQFDRSGDSVSGAGDVNGDGFDDVLIGAYSADPNGDYSGSSYVVFGKASGFDATMDLSSLDGSNGFRLDGAKSEHSGSSVSNAGDVNGDGFDDVIVNAPHAALNNHYSSSSYVIFGKASGFDATMNLSSLDGKNGFRLDVAWNRSVNSAAGDVNGDGFDDVIIGVPPSGLNGRSSGSSYVVFGKDSGFDATMDLSSLDGSNGFRLDGVAVGDFSGRSVSSAGDVNGDGFDDVIIGADGADPFGNNSGSSYVLFGKTSGFDAVINLSNLDGTNGIRLDGAAKDDNSGRSVSSAGDVNGDGFDDLLVGAPEADQNGSSSGSSYVIFGRSSFVDDIDFPGTPGDDIFTGTSAAEIFEAGDGNDRMIGHGGADVFHGGAGNDRIRVSDLSFQLADGGSGNSDVLSLGGGGNLNLDLADARGKISGIEIIYLHGGSGDKTLTLNATDVLNLSDTSNTLKVNGNEGDRVILQGDWADGGIQGGFHIYTSDAAASPEAAVLLVGINLTADFA